MAEKKTALVPTEDIKYMVVSDAALDAYNFALRNAGVEMDEETEADFITRRNAKSGWRELWELKSKCEKFAASIKEVVKHTFNVGSEDQIPNDDGVKISWSKQSFTYEWECEDAPRFVAQKLIESNLVKAEQLFDVLKVEQVTKASGITIDKLNELFEGAVKIKPKERTLSIK